MIRFTGKGMVLDIEGTVSPIRFVYDVLFPYVRQRLVAFLDTHWTKPDVVLARELIAKDAGVPSFAAWCGESISRREARERLCAEVYRLMDSDAKATGLKELQGLIWHEGYRSGLLCSRIFPDVPPCLAAWSAARLDVRVYSSGSVTAQRLFFTNTEFGDLSNYFRGYYDTTAGPKQAPASYTAIVADMRISPAEVLFLSDVTAELEAARVAGLQTALVVRPGNAPPPPEATHARVDDFAQIVLSF